MFRSFKITLPADTNNHNLYSLIVGPLYPAPRGTNEPGITGAVPVDGIFPDRGNNLQILADGGNTGNIVISDRNFATVLGGVLAKGATFSVQSTRNSICSKDYFISGSAVSQVLEVSFEFI